MEEQLLSQNITSITVDYHQIEGEHHYIRKLSDTLLIGIVSKKALDAIELTNLLVHVEQVHFKKMPTHITLEHIIANPLRFTAEDPRVGLIKDEIEITRNELLKAVKLLIERGEHLEKLVIQSEQLAEAASNFKVKLLLWQMVILCLTASLPLGRLRINVIKPHLMPIRINWLLTTNFI